MIDLRTFLVAIIDTNLTLNLNKCRFVRPQVSFVRHVIGSGCHGHEW